MSGHMSVTLTWESLTKLVWRIYNTVSNKLLINRERSLINREKRVYVTSYKMGTRRLARGYITIIHFNLSKNVFSI